MFLFIFLRQSSAFTINNKSKGKFKVIDEFRNVVQIKFVRRKQV